VSELYPEPELRGRLKDAKAVEPLLFELLVAEAFRYLGARLSKGAPSESEYRVAFSDTAPVAIQCKRIVMPARQRIAQEVWRRLSERCRQALRERSLCGRIDIEADQLPGAEHEIDICAEVQRTLERAERTGGSSAGCAGPWRVRVRTFPRDIYLPVGTLLDEQPHDFADVVGRAAPGYVLRFPPEPNPLVAEVTVFNAISNELPDWRRPLKDRFNRACRQLPASGPGLVYLGLPLHQRVGPKEMLREAGDLLAPYLGAQNRRVNAIVLAVIADTASGPCLVVRTLRHPNPRDPLSPSFRLALDVEELDHDLGPGRASN
jgi:hypothetical protein